MTKAAPLNSVVMPVRPSTQKGQAVASVPTERKETVQLPDVSVPSISPVEVQAGDTVAKLLATKSMTVKIDEVSYKKLKGHGLNIGKTSQDIFVAALALYFKEHRI